MHLPYGWVMYSAAEGAVLSAALVGVWEWESMTIQRRWPQRAALALVFGGPVTLTLVAFCCGVRVPIAIFSICLAAVWFLVPSQTCRWVGTASLLAALLAQSLDAFGWSARTAVDVFVLAGTAVVLAATIQRRHHFAYAMSIYLGVVGLGMALLDINRDPLQDLAVSAVTAALLAVYIVGRADREQALLQNVYRAEHDALTGTLTRYGLDSWLLRPQTEGATTGLVVACDLDDFKSVNDTWGHDDGDQLLQAFACRCRTELCPQDALVRPGGDEFVAWMPARTLADAPRLVQRLHRAVTTDTYELPTGTFRLGVSLGWAVGPLNADTAHAADQALLLAKTRGKNCIATLSEGVSAAERRPQLTRGSRSRLSWLAEAARVLWADWHVGAVLTDAQGRIVAVNPTYERLAGRRWAELAERKPGINSAGETVAEVYQGLWKTISTGRPWQGHFRNRRPDGTSWLARERIAPIRVEGEIVGYWAEVVEHPGLAGSDPGPDAASEPRIPRRSSKAMTRWNLGGIDLGVAFQPIVDLYSESVLGYEALIRPRRDGEPLTPQAFFAEAAAAGAEIEADAACLAAIRRVLAARPAWPPNQRLFVNVQSATLKRGATFRGSLQALTALVPQQQVVVEVSERGTEDLANWEVIAQNHPSVVFAQDDVGSGEADLARLVRLPSAWLKIDISLVSRLVDDPAACRLVTALSEWAHGSGARVIAEGVETVAQGLALRSCGVDAGQGYLWGEPSPAPPPVVPKLRGLQMSSPT